MLSGEKPGQNRDYGEEEQTGTSLTPWMYSNSNLFQMINNKPWIQLKDLLPPHRVPHHFIFSHLPQVTREEGMKSYRKYKIKFPSHYLLLNQAPCPFLVMDL